MRSSHPQYDMHKRLPKQVHLTTRPRWLTVVEIIILFVSNHHRKDVYQRVFINKNKTKLEMLVDSGIRSFWFATTTTTNVLFFKQVMTLAVISADSNGCYRLHTDISDTTHLSKKWKNQKEFEKINLKKIQFCRGSNLWPPRVVGVPRYSSN